MDFFMRKHDEMTTSHNFYTKTFNRFSVLTSDDILAFSRKTAYLGAFPLFFDKRIDIFSQLSYNFFKKKDRLKAEFAL